MSTSDQRVARWYFGGLAGAMAASVSHPLDLIKVILQTQKQGEKASIAQITKDIVRKNGVLGLYSGLSAAVLRQLTYTTTRFGIYEALKKQVKSDSFHSKVGLAGIAGLCGGLVGAPTDLVNVRMQNDIKLPPEKRRNYKHPIDGFRRVIKEEGLGALFAGASTSGPRAVLMTIGQLSFYDQVKQVLLATGLFRDSMGTHLLSSATAGGIATLITQPLDVLRTRMMNAKPGEYKNVFHCIKVTAAGGPQTFFKGFLPAVTRIMPTTVLVFLLYEQLRQNFGYIPQKQPAP